LPVTFRRGLTCLCAYSGYHFESNDEALLLNQAEGARLVHWQREEGFVALSFSKPGAVELAMVSLHGDVTVLTELPFAVT